MLAFGGQVNRLDVVAFPSGDLVGSWRLVGYEVGQVRWAPDGRAIVADGYRSGRDGVDGSALFLIRMPAP
jgi:hypothetical protein